MNYPGCTCPAWRTECFDNCPSKQPYAPRDEYAKAYPTDDLGQQDAGADSERRQRQCKRRTWCTRTEHTQDEPCCEVPRVRIEPSDFGPAEATRRQR